MSAVSVFRRFFVIFVKLAKILSVTELNVMLILYAKNKQEKLLLLSQFTAISKRSVVCPTSRALNGYFFALMQGGENRIQKCLQGFGLVTRVVNHLQFTDVSASKLNMFDSRHVNWYFNEGNVLNAGRCPLGRFGPYSGGRWHISNGSWSCQ